MTRGHRSAARGYLLAAAGAALEPALAAVAWLQSKRPDLEAEGAPPSRAKARFSPR